MEIINLKDSMGYFDLLAEYHQNEWAHLTDGETLEERKIRMKQYLSKDFIPSIYIAKNNNELLGSAAIVGCDMDTKPELTPWLASVFVLPEHRKKGIATKLVKHIMQKTKEYNVTKMYLYTETAESVYSKLGWKTITRESYKKQPVIVMEVDLISHFRS